MFTDLAVQKLRLWPGRVFGLFAFLYANVVYAQSGPSNINISGALFDASGAAITSASVNFKIELYDKGATCLIYTEDHLGVDLSQTKGGFSIDIGSGSSIQNLIDSGSPAAMSSKVYENPGVIAGGWAGCPSGATLADGDSRVIRVLYNLGGGYVAMNPDVPIAAAAYATVAQTLQGKRPSDFIQVHNDVSNKLTQANVENVFSSTNYPKLTALLGGSSTDYMSATPSAAVGFNNQRITNLADPTAASDAATKNYADSYLGGKNVDVSGVGPATGDGYTLIWDKTAGKWTTGVPSATDNTKLPLAGGTMSGAILFDAALGTGIDLNSNDLLATGHITMSPLKTLTLGAFTDGQETTLIGTLTAANAGASWYNTTSNTFKIWNGSAAISQTFNGATAGGDLTGTYPNPTIANDKITSAKVDSAGIGLNRLVISDQTTGANLKFATCGTNEVLRYEGVNGWICRDPSAIVTFPVKTVNGKTGDAAGEVTLNPVDLGLGTAALENVGTGAGDIPQLDAGGKIPSSLIPAASAPTWGDITNGAGKYMTYKPNNTACGNDELLKFDGTNWICVAASALGLGDFMKDGSVAMTGDFDGGTHNITNIGSVSGSALTLTSTGANNGITLTPNGTGLVTTSSALRVTPTALPGTPAAGTIAFDSGSANAMKYYDGSAWVAIGSGTGDFLKNGSVAMTGDFDAGTHNLINIGTNVTGAAAVTLASGGTSDLTLTSASGVLNSTTPLKISPTALPGTPAAGTIAFDSGASNVLKYYNGSAWQTVNTSNATGDFMKDGSVAMTGDFNGGTKNLTNIGANIDAAAGLTITTASNNDLNLAPNGTGLVTTSSALRVTPTSLPGTPAAGTIAFDSGAANAMKYYDGSAWIAIGSGTGDFLKNGSVAMTGDFDGGTHNITNIGSVSGSALTLTSTGANNGITLTPNGTGLVTTSSALLVTPTALPATPAAGVIAFDSGASNALKYYNGSAWQTVNTSNATGDFMKDGSVAMTGDFNAGGNSVLGNTTASANLTLESTSDATKGYVLIQPNGGNVGIGTTTPIYNLDVKATNNSYATINAGNFNTGAGAGGILSAQSDAGSTVLKQLSTAAGGVGQILTDGTALDMRANAVAGYIAFDTGGANERMRITAAGDVGIGTNNPARLLHVNGAARFTPTTEPTSPAAGDLFFDSGAANALKFYDGAAWQTVGTGTGSGDFMKDGSVAMTGNFNAGTKNLTNIGTNINAAAGLTITTASNNDLNLAPNGTGLVTTSSALRVTPTALPGTPAAGTIAFDSGSANAMKYYDGTAWQTLGTGTGSGDFMKNGSVAMTGNFNAGGNSVLGNTTASANLTLESTSDATKGYVNIQPNGGNVGIGTTSPSAALQVVSTTVDGIDVAASGGSNAVSAVTSGGGTALWGSGGAGGQGVFGQATGSGSTGVIGQATDVGIQGVSTGTGSGSIGVFAQATGSSNTGAAIVAENNSATGWSIYSSGSSPTYFAGNVGIGTTSPARLLHVNGAARLTPTTTPASAAAGDLFFDSAASNALKFYDGAAWQTVGTGTGNGDFKKDGSVAMTGDFNAGTKNLTNIGTNITGAAAVILASGGTSDLTLTSASGVLNSTTPLKISPTTLPASPAAGTIAMDSSTGNAMKYYDGTAWQTLGTGTGSGDFMKNGSVAMTGDFDGGTHNITNIGSVSGSALTLSSTGANNGITLTPNGTGLVTTSSALLVTPTALPAAPAAGVIAFDSGASNVLKYYNGSAWQTVNTSNATGDFMKDGSVAMTGDFNGGTKNLTNIGTNINAAAGLTLTTASNNDLNLAPNGTGLVTTSSALRVTPTALPGTPTAGTIAFDSGAANALKFYDGSAWQTVGTGTGNGDFKKDGSVAMTGDFDGGTHNITNISAVSGSNVSITSTGANNGITLTPNGTGLVTTSSALLVTPTALPATPAAGVIAFDSGASNVLKYYNGSAWQTVNTSNATGDFMKDGSVAMTGDFNGGTKNLTNIGTNIDAAAGLTITTTSNNDLNLAPNGTGLVTTSSPLRVTPTALPGTPAAGTIAFDSGSANALKFYDGSTWQTVGTGTGSGDFMKDGSVAMTGNLKLGANYISNDGGANEGLAFDTSGNANFTGNVGIGTTAPAQKLSLYDSSSVGTKISTQNNEISITADEAATSASLLMQTGSGTAEMGTWNGTTSLSLTGGYGGSGAKVNLETYSATNGNTLDLFRNRVFPDQVADGDNIYSINATSQTSTQRATGTSIRSVIDGTPGSGTAMPARFEFWTNDGAAFGQRMTIKASGNVGIGTDTPARLLHVNGAARLTPTTTPATPAAGDLFFDSAASNALKFYDGSAWQTVGTGTGNGDFKKDGSVAMTGNLKLGANYISNDGGTSEGLAFDTSGNANFTGNVGIGTATPSGLLHVYGGSVSGANGKGITLQAQSASSLSYDGGSINLLPGTTAGGGGVAGTVNVGSINNSNKAAFNVISNANTDSTSVSTYAMSVTDEEEDLHRMYLGFDYSLNAGLIQSIYLGSGVSNTLINPNGGNVGIGTTSPARLLHVNGAARLTPTTTPATPAAGDLFFDSAASNALKFYDGAAWQTVGTGTGSGDFMKNGSVAMTGNFNAGGNSILGNTTASANLTLESTSDATKGFVNIQPNGGNVGIGTNAPSNQLDVQTSVNGTKTLISAQNKFAGSSAVTNISLGNDSTQLLSFSLNSSTFSGGMGAGAGGLVGNVSPLYMQNNGVGSGSNIVFANNGSTERMRIDYNGNVGIGTANPGALLHVNGPMRLTPAALPGTPAAGDLAFDSGAANALKFYDGSAWQTVGTGTGSGDFMKNGSVAMTGNLKLGANYISNDGGASEGLAFDTSGNANFTGNVGVGTATPGNRLEVYRSVNSTNYLIVNNPNTGTSAETGLQLNTNAGSVGYFWTGGSNHNQVQYRGRVMVSSDGSNGGGIGIEAVGGSSDIRFSTGGGLNSDERMRITNTGNVGIGTDTPARLLHVNGAARLTPTTTPATPAAGDLFFDSAASNALKFYNGSAWQTVGTGTGSGDFMKDGSVTMTGNLKLGANYISNDGGASEGLTFDTSGNAQFTGNIDGDGYVNAATVAAIKGDAGVYSATSASLSNPNGSIVNTWNTYAGDGVAGTFVITANNASSKSQNAYFAAVSNTGAANYTPTIVIGQQTGATAYAERMRIDSSGNVGIGTTAPARLLHVNGAARLTPTTTPATPAAGDLFFDSAASNALKFYDGSAWQTVGTGTGSGDFMKNGSVAMTGNFNAGGNSVLGNTTASANLKLESTSDATKGYVLIQPNGGNVGIGTASPARLLHVNGAARFTPTTTPSSPAAGDIFFDSSAANALKFYDGSAWQTVGTSGTGDFKKDGSVAMTGNFNAGGNKVLGNTTASAALTLESTSHATKGNVYINPNGGKIGIGTTSVGATDFLAIENTSGQNVVIDKNAVGSWVGIGTEPVTTFHVLSSDSAWGGAIFENTDTAASATYTTLNNARRVSTVGAGVGTSFMMLNASTNRAEYGYFGALIENSTPGTESGAIAFYPRRNNTRTEALRITSAGNVGIGTTAPVDLVSLGAVNASATHASLNLSNTALSGASASGTYIGANPASASADFINYQVAGTTKFSVDKNGKVTGDGSGLTGISAAPAGSNTQVQFNNSGAMGASANLVWDNTNGRLGIGTTTPGYSLDIVSGGVRANRTMTFTSGSSWGTNNGNNFVANYGPSGAVSANTVAAGTVFSTLSTGSVSMSNATVVGAYFDAETGNTQSVGELDGTYNYAANWNNATVTNMNGNNTYSQNGSTGTVTNMVGQRSYVTNSGGGNVTASYGGYYSSDNSGSGTTSNAYGIYTKITKSAGTISNGFGVYIGGINATTKYGLYQNDATANNYFGGSVGIGTTAPAQALDVTGNIAASGRVIAGLTTNSNALSSVTADFSASNTIRSTAASGACTTLNITNTTAGGQYVLTMMNATSTCTTIQWNGSSTNVKTPAGYAGGTPVSGVVYTFVDDGQYLIVTHAQY